MAMQTALHNDPGSHLHARRVWLSRLGLLHFLYTSGWLHIIFLCGQSSVFSVTSDYHVVRELMTYKYRRLNISGIPQLSHMYHCKNYTARRSLVRKLYMSRSLLVHAWK